MSISFDVQAGERIAVTFWDPYLYKLRLHLKHLLPAVVPHVVSSPNPVLAVFGQFSIEPR